MSKLNALKNEKKSMIQITAEGKKRFLEMVSKTLEVDNGLKLVADGTESIEQLAERYHGCSMSIHKDNYPDCLSFVITDSSDNVKLCGVIALNHFCDWSINT